MSSDTAWSIPCCAAVSASISVEEPLSAVGALLCQLGDDSTEGRSEECAAAYEKVGTMYNKSGLEQCLVHLHVTQACKEYSDSRLVTYWEGDRQFGSPSTPYIPCAPSISLPLELGLITKGLSSSSGYIEPRRGQITEQFVYSIGACFTTMASLVNS